MQLNVLGGELESCCFAPITGFYRDGYCNTSIEDTGSHTVCVRMSTSFLLFSSKVGNDLSTPRPEYEFPGLIEGDQWCLCAARWKEAYDAGVAPSVVLSSTHQRALEIIPLELLMEYAIDLNY
jgi:uncharacterized protein (DUF2237 family)